jgi:hypothetical protein
MKRFVTNLIAAVAVASTTLVAIAPTAHAGDRYHHRDRTGDFIAAGVIGLAAGALIAGAAQAQPRVYYEYAPEPVYQPRPRYVYERPRQVYYEQYVTYEPWTREWYRYCSNRYRSFDPSSGTFMGYDGVRRFCEAN